LEKADPIKIAEKSAKFTIALFKDSAFQQMEKLLIINSIIFAILYLVAWKLFSPSKLFDELVE